MAQLIHARKTPAGYRYRVWSTITDTYLTDALDDDAMRSWLYRQEMEEARRRYVEDTDKRLVRARIHGSSALNGYASGGGVTGPWETERCEKCNGFHHDFGRRDYDGSCAQCGEPESDVAHGPPCDAAVDQ